jgi:hypothetical protein
MEQYCGDVITVQHLIKKDNFNKFSLEFHNIKSFYNSFVALDILM